MTHITDTLSIPSFRTADVIGPFSPWPRKRRRFGTRVRAIIYAGAAAGAGVLAHCVVPLVA